MSLHGKKDYSIYRPGRFKMGDLLNNKDNFNEVLYPEPGDLVVVDLPSDLNPNAFILAHVSMYILPNIVFEKTDTSDRDPFRFGFLTDTHAWAKKENSGYRVRYLRYSKKTPIEGHIAIPFEDYIKSEFPDRKMEDKSFFAASILDRKIITGFEIKLGSGSERILSVPEVIQFKKTGSKLEITSPQIGNNFKEFDHPLLN